MIPIRLERVTHSYNDRNVLTEFSITFEEKKLTAILGKSGSGKSTLLQVINGLIRPTSGEVFLFDQRLDQKNAYSFRQKLGYVVQGTGLFPHLTVEQNISISKKIIASSEKLSSSRTEELMSLVNLPLHYKTKYPHQLSGGEQQRVGLCRALYLDPPVLLLDEPLSALDSITRMDIRQEIINLQHQAPRTVLFVTHDMHDAQKLADNILIIDEGKLQQYGPVSEVIAHPAAPIVESLIKAALT
jgi:osmoprotectant transport system ATP-binding protein